MKSEVKTKDDIMCVALSGDIDLEFSGEVRRVLMETIPKGRLIEVDMREVSLIDSSGVASLLEALQMARKSGKDFILLNVTDPVMRVLRLARLDTVFTFETS
ncbi:MAG: STAS domain-containing protein [Magnetovibrionaceae bacterium]